MKPVAITHKAPLEERPVGLTYRAPDVPNGTTILSTSVTVSPSGLTLGTSGVLADGVTVYCWLTGGTDATDYRVRFTSTLSDGKKLIDEILVKCLN